MTLTVASVKIETTTGAQRTLTFPVEFDSTSAVVRYRSAFFVSETDVVLTVSHHDGRLHHVNWNQHWQRYLAPAIRSKLVSKVQQLLHTHCRKPEVDG